MPTSGLGTLFLTLQRVLDGIHFSVTPDLSVISMCPIMSRLNSASSSAGTQELRTHTISNRLKGVATYEICDDLEFRDKPGAALLYVPVARDLGRVIFVRHRIEDRIRSFCLRYESFDVISHTGIPATTREELPPECAADVVPGSEMGVMWDQSAKPGSSRCHQPPANRACARRMTSGSDSTGGEQVVPRHR
jgi:hypothetical protein